MLMTCCMDGEVRGATELTWRKGSLYWLTNGSKWMVGKPHWNTQYCSDDWWISNVVTSSASPPVFSFIIQRSCFRTVRQKKNEAALVVPAAFIFTFIVMGQRFQHKATRWSYWDKLQKNVSIIHPDHRWTYSKSVAGLLEGWKVQLSVPVHWLEMCWKTMPCKTGQSRV